MNNLTRLQLIDSDVKGFLNIKGDTKVPLNFSVSDIRDISSRTGMFSKTITLTGDKNNNNILNNYFDVNIVAGTFDVNKRQKVTIVQNGIILRDNCFMRLLKVVKKQSVDINIDEYVEYEVQVTDELGDFFKDVGNKELKELDGWSKYKHIYGVDAVVDSFDHTEVDGYKYTLPFISDGQFVMNDLMPGVYAKQIFDRIHSMNGFSYDWATIADDDTQFDKSILPYSGDKKKLTEEYINSIEVKAENTIDTIYTVPSYGNGSPSTARQIVDINDEIKDNNNLYDNANSEYTNQFDILAPNSLIYEVKINWQLEVINNNAMSVMINPQFSTPGQVVETSTGVRNSIEVRKNGLHTMSTQRLTEIKPLKFGSESYDDTGLSGEDLVSVSNDKYVTMRRRLSVAASSSRVLAIGTERFTMNPTSIDGGDTLRLAALMESRTAGTVDKWNENGGTMRPKDVSYRNKITSIEISIKPSSDNGLMPGAIINIRDFLPNKMKQSDFLKTIYQKYNLYVEVDPNEPNKLVYTSRDKFYDDGEIKDWTKKLDKKKEQELYFIPDITTKKMILSYKDDDKDFLLSAYRGETSKTFGQVDVTFDNENIKGEERKEELFSPTINMKTDFDAVLPVLNADFKMNQRILQDGGKLSCSEYSLKESDSKIITSSFYPHLSMFDRPYNPTFSTEYAQSSYYAYRPGLFTENNLYTMHWRRTLAQINSGKMLKAYFWLTEEDIQKLRMNDKIKLNNTFYYINSIIDYDANSNSVTKVELLTVEDDLKLPRVGGRIKDIEHVMDLVVGKVSAKVPSTPGGFFTSSIADVIKKRYDENVVVAGPTPLTGNLGMGNKLPSEFRGIVIGDNLTPTENGLYVGEDNSFTESGLKVNSIEAPGFTISEDGDINFTGPVTGIEQNYLPIADRRSTNENPQWYFDNFPRKTTNEFKTINVMGLGSIFTLGSYCGVETINQWLDVSGGYPFQIATNPRDGKIAKRYGVSATAWSNWEEIGAGGGGGSMTIIPKTYTELKNLKNSNSLAPGVRYYISDRDIWIDALDSNKLAMECKRHFRIVKDAYYTPHINVLGNNIYYLGIYGQGISKGSVPNSATFGDAYFAIWGGRMWQRNNSGADTPGTGFGTIQSGWTIQSTTNNAYYESKIFDIKYDFDEDRIWEQSDDRGNIIKRYGIMGYWIDITDWGNVDIYNNENFGIFNNFRGSNKAHISTNSNNGGIWNNSNSGGYLDVGINGNSNNGNISNNSNNGAINNNSNGGNIQGNSNDGGIQNNSNSGGLNGGFISSNKNNSSIQDNSNNGDIYDNSNNVGIIQNNSNNGDIWVNSNNGDIFYNSNNDDIRGNSNDGYIQSNSNNGPIQNNSNIGNIHTNSNSGHISGNLNYGGIRNNSNIGHIRNNSNISGATHIMFNTNTGWISRNVMNGSYKLEYNTNNGNIGLVDINTTRNGDITDAPIPDDK